MTELRQPRPKSTHRHGRAFDRAASHLDAATDASVVRAIALGDVAGLAQAYDRHAPMVYGLARRLWAEPDADRVTEEVFLELWAAPSRFASGGRPLLGSLLAAVVDRASAGQPDGSPTPGRPTRADCS